MKLRQIRSSRGRPSRRPRARLDCESLEQRLALAASYSFIDQAGNVVTVTTSKGTNAQLAQSLTFTPKSQFASHLDAIHLVDPAFAGTSLAITSKTAANQPATVAIGDVMSAYPLGTVTIAGDITSISANTNKPDSFAGSAIASLHIGTIGVAASAGNSSIHGTVGSLTLDGSNNGGTVEAYSIGKIVVGGSLVGGVGLGSGSIRCIGAVTGPVTIAGSLLGGDGERSGSINASTLGGVLVGGSLLGGVGFRSGSIVADKIGKVFVAGDVRGGTSLETGIISSRVGGIDGLTIQGSLVGSSGVLSGIVWSAGGIGPVVVGESILGGNGPSSGLIQSDTGSIASVSVSGSVTGGSGNESGAIKAGAGGIGTVAITHSLLGGIGSNSGEIYAQGSIGPLKIGVDLTGGEGDFSGSVVTALGKILGVSVAGSVRHGNGSDSGSIKSSTGLGKVWVGGDVWWSTISSKGLIQGVTVDGYFGGLVATYGAVGSIHVGKNFGTKDGFGAVSAGQCGPVTIGGDVTGLVRTFPNNSGTDGSIDSITVGGSLKGLSEYYSASFIAEGTIGKVSIAGDIIGGDSVQTGYIAGKKGIGAITAKSLQGGKDLLSGAIDSGGGLGLVTITGGISGGSGERSGTIHAEKSIAGVAVGLSITGGAGATSGSIRAGGVLQSLKVNGSVTGFGADPVLITAGGNVGPLGRAAKSAMPMIKVSGALTRACILAGYSDQSLTVVNESARIGAITLGSLEASSIVAGVSNAGFPNFGDANDANSKTVAAPAIASVNIVGSAKGSANAAERFGLVATSFGQVSIAGSVLFQPSKGVAAAIGTPVGGIKNLFLHRL